MKFIYTPDDVQPIAEAVAKHLQRDRFKVTPEEQVDDEVHFRPTLYAKRDELLVFVEAQVSPRAIQPLVDLARWVAAKRLNAETYIATRADDDIKAGFLLEIMREGIGHFVVEEQGEVEVSIPPRNPALQVTPEPALKYGTYKREVMNCVNDFNKGNRKPALGDMCDIVENLTEVLGKKAIRKQWLDFEECRFEQCDWGNRINLLSAARRYNAGHSPLFPETLANDMHSFRGARNLLKHKPRNKREKRRLEHQFAERMMTGPRLVAEIVSLMRRVK